MRLIYIEMKKINKNIRLTFAIASVGFIVAIFVLEGSIAANEPDTVSFKVEKPVINSNSVVSDRSIHNVQFPDNNNSNEAGNSSYGNRKDLSPGKPDGNDDNLQDSYSGNTIFGAAMSIIYRLFQYFL